MDWYSEFEQHAIIALRNVFRPRDFTEFKYLLGYDHLTSYDFEHRQELTFNNRVMHLGALASLDKSSGKFESQQISTGFTFDHEYVPLVFKLVHSYRTNLLDKHASMEAYKNEIIPSRKVSFIAEYMKNWNNALFGTAAEFGIPNNSPNFVRLNTNFYAHHFFSENRFKIGYDFTGGVVFPLTTTDNKYIHINDRFFLLNEYGFEYTSHTEPSARPIPNLKRDEVQLGDDLGSNALLAQTIRFHWMNFPFLSLISVSPMVYLRMYYYPKNGFFPMNKHIRVSSGVGFGTHIMPNLSILFYYNLGNLVSQQGDHERHSFGLTFAIF